MIKSIIKINNKHIKYNLVFISLLVNALRAMTAATGITIAPRLALKPIIKNKIDKATGENIFLWMKHIKSNKRENDDVRCRVSNAPRFN